MNDSVDWELRGSDPLLRDHVVDGRRMLPGLAYLDLLLRMAQRRGLPHTGHYLDRLTIIHPLHIEQDETAQLRTSFSRMDAGWRLTVSGLKQGPQGRTAEPTVFAKADLREEAVSLHRQLDIQSLKAASRARVDLNELYTRASRNGLRHAGLMRAQGTMFVLPEGGLIELRVGPNHASEARDVLCHPTLMDGAAIASGGLQHDTRAPEREGLFIPLAYDSFRLLHPLQAQCFALIELASFKSVNDIRKLDIDFFDPAGRHCAALRGLTAKLVRAELRRSRPAADSAAAVQNLLSGILARHLNRDAASIDANVGFYELGFKSADLVQLLAELEEQLSLTLPPSLLFEYATLRELSQHLEAELARAGRHRSANQPAAPAPAPAPASASASASAERDEPQPDETPRGESSPLALLPQVFARLAGLSERALPVELRGIVLGSRASPDSAGMASPSVREVVACSSRRDAIDLQALLAQTLQSKLHLHAEKLASLSPPPHGPALEAIERLRIFRPLAEATWLISKPRSASPSHQSFDAFLVSDGGEVIAEGTDISFIPAAVARERIRPERVDVAVIGMSGRYPRARDLASFWRNLRDGVDCIDEVPPERWNWRLHYTTESSAAYSHRSKWGGFIAGADEFDADFFGISAQEAAALDPQERLFLQEAWSAVEDAGYTREGLAKAGGRAHDSADSNDVSVYVGVMYADYQLHAEPAGGVPISIHPGTIAHRVSYCLNLNGPSLAVDALCASSLASIHLACEDLRTGRSRLAIAGGVNLTLHPNKYAHLSAAGLLSAAPRCESFGRGGEGYVPSEGVGALLLKRLTDAEADGDHILGVIRASALNHGGKAGAFSVPNLRQQRAVIERALAAAGVDASEVSYVEAHATGTTLGDSIEAAALTQAFRKTTSDTGFCLLGSAKSNIGHAESAAGIAGVTKILLQMQHGSVAPSLHAEEPNPYIDFSSSPFVVNRQLSAWRRPARRDASGALREVPRIAGISSFGATGANAHLIIQEYDPTAEAPRAMPEQSVGRPVLVPLSARDADRLREVADRLRTHIDHWLEAARSQAGDIDARTFAARAYAHLMDIAFTLQVGRESMSARRICIAQSLQELHEQLAGETLAPVLADDPELQDIARRWLKGETVDWWPVASDSGGFRPRRISLPTYPFARQRHWISESPSSAAESAAGSAVAAIQTARAPGTPVGDSVETLLRRIVARHLRCRPEEIASQASFFELGLDSFGIVKVSQELEQILRKPITPTLLFEYDGVAMLARHLAGPVQSATDVDGNVLAILEDLKRGALTPGQARELIGTE